MKTISNSDELLEKKILDAIKQKAEYPLTFSEITKTFDEKFSNFNPAKNSVNIAEYFGQGIGEVSSRKKLIADGKIKEEWLRKYQTKSGKIKYDFKGLYIFLNNDTPFYVGISKGVIGRTFQHLKGHNHNTSTLAYNISLIRHELLTGKKHLGTRNELNFKTNVEPAKTFLLKQKIAFHYIKDPEELYLFEVYCAMKLQTFLNKFETH